MVLLSRATLKRFTCDPHKSSLPYSQCAWITTNLMPRSSLPSSSSRKIFQPWDLARLGSAQLYLPAPPDLPLGESWIIFEKQFDFYFIIQKASGSWIWSLCESSTRWLGDRGEITFIRFFGISFILGFSQFLSYGVVFSIWPESSWVILDIFIRGTFQTALWRFPLQLIIQLLDEDIT